MTIEIPDNLYEDIQKLIKDKGATNAPKSDDIDALIDSNNNNNKYWGEEVTTKRNWKSSEDHPETFLCYLTVAEAKLLRSLGLGYSLIDGEYKQHYNKDGIPSFNGYEDSGDGTSPSDNANGGGIGRPGGSVNTGDFGGGSGSGDSSSDSTSLTSSTIQKAVDSVFGPGTYEKSVEAARHSYEQNVASTFGLSHDVMEQMGYDLGYGYSAGFGVTMDPQMAEMLGHELLDRALNTSYDLDATLTTNGFGFDLGEIGSRSVDTVDIVGDTMSMYNVSRATINSTPTFDTYYSPTMTTMDKIKAAFSSLNGIAQELSNSITGIMDPKTYTMYVDTQPAPYAANAGATAVYEVSKGFFTDTAVTTLTTPNMMGGYDVMRSDVGGLTSMGDQVDMYSTNMRGEVVSHTTEVSLGNGLSFSYDTHYWSGNNTQFGFAAEAVADMAEYFGAKTSTVLGLAKAAEVISSFVSALMPSVQLLSAATSIMKMNSTIGGLFAIGGIISVYEELDRLSNMFTGRGFLDAPSNTDYSLSSSLSSVMLSKNDGERGDLGKLVEIDNTEETVLSLLGTSLASTNTSMMPQIISPVKYVKPTTNQENNMQSQQAVFIDYRGGLSEILAPNLIGANEGSIFTNVDVNKGTMRNVQIGSTTESIETNKYNMFLPNDKMFYSDYSFNAIKLGNFIYMTIDDDSYPYVYQLDYQSLATEYATETDLVRVQLDAPATDPVISDNLVSKLVITLAVDDNDSPADTSDNVRIGDVLRIYYGDTQLTETDALVAGDIESGLYEVLLDGYYPEEDDDLFSYRIVRAGSVIVPETNFVVLENEDELESELWEEYVYAYTYYNSTSGFESAPVFSDNYLKKSQGITIDLEYTTDTKVDYIRLYRIGGYSSSYRLIKEIPNNTSGGTYSYGDFCSEEYIPTLLDTQNLAIIEDLKGLIEHKGTLFAYKNNEVYFSRPGKANMWSNYNMIRVGGSVSGLASTPLGVLIFTDNSQTFILGGTDKYNFTLSTLTKSVGCISKQSINNYKNTAIWLNYEGLMMSVGSSVTNISKEKVNISNIGNIVESMVYDNVYYLVGSNYMLTVDFKYNQPSFRKIESAGAQIVKHILNHKGKIYTEVGNSWYEDSFNNTGDNLSLNYKAPMFIGNSYDILTEFNKINLTYKGNISYKVYVDEVEVLTGSLSSDKVTVEEIKIPTDNNEGLGLELELIGSGEIKAFRYIFSNVNTN